MRVRAHALAILSLILLPLPLGAETLWVGRFSAGDLQGWEAKVFNRPTDYRIVELGDRRVLQATCENAASALYRRLRVDLVRTPMLRWSWRVEGAYRGLDETRKQGDDYLARLYVVIDGGALLWRTRALNYVWASGRPVGSAWPNAYTGQAMMLALRSGPDAQWREELRDLRRDFREQFGIEARQIDGVALMTDCDDSAGRGRAWYGDIRFTSE
ncbi:MAG TPA: DUF3047 domain-containing protein [Nevskiales bacterium]|nr:DUF3047 domain-containing protein [Nevskiales bacterium]